MGDESVLIQPDDDLMDHYLDYTEKTVEELRLLAARLEDEEAPVALNEEMHALAHNIKGMGSSFGFPLMTSVGSILCTYLQALDDGRVATASIVAAHLKAMDTILKNRILGNGGPEGEALIARLDEITSA
jgi:chemotaxis protein histidine kinase CheA